MTAVRLRTVLRWFHIGVAVVLGAYIYSPLRADPFWTDIVRFGVVPMATLTGIWLWKQGRVAKLLRSRSSAGRA